MDKQTGRPTLESDVPLTFNNQNFFEQNFIFYQTVYLRISFDVYS